MGDQDAGPFQSSSVPEGYRQYLEPVIFGPWARRLTAFVNLEPDQVVLDVASGTGVVARAAARVVGPGGRVIASDISSAMLAHVLTGLDDDDAEVQTLECSALDLLVPDGSVDVVLCQQGFPFIPDRTAAAKEMNRVLRPGGMVGIAVWLSGERLEPFETYGEIMQSEGIVEPFPHAYDTDTFKMSVRDVEQALAAGGFGYVTVSTEDLELTWGSADAAAMGITGTPYGPAVAALDADGQRRFMALVSKAFGDDDGAVSPQVMTAVLGRGTAS
jgi:SAM-dependent methyltransferase